MNFIQRLKWGFRSKSPRVRKTPFAILSLENMEQRLVLNSSSAWSPIGSVIYNDQIDAPPPDHIVSGRVTAISIDPTDTTGNTVFIGSAGGGVWKGTDIQSKSPTWTELTKKNLANTIVNPGSNVIGDPLLTLTVGSLATLPGANGTIIYAGLGEANSISTYMNPSKANSQFYGTGMIKSIDGGQNWTLLGGSGSSNIFYGSSISKIVVFHDSKKPESLDTVYAAVATAKNGVTGHEGIWKSTDAGLTWVNTTATAIPGSNQDMFSDLVMPKHDNPKFLIAAIGEPVGSVNNGVYETLDGGTTWVELKNLPNGQGVGRITLATSSVHDSDKFELYAAFIANSLTQSATITSVSQTPQPATDGMYTVTVNFDGMVGPKFDKDMDISISGLNPLGESVGFDGNFKITSVDPKGKFLEYQTPDAIPALSPIPQNATVSSPFGTLYQLGHITVNGGSGDLTTNWNALEGFTLPSATYKDINNGKIYKNIRNYVSGSEDNGLDRSYQGFYDTSLIVDPDPKKFDHIYVGGMDSFLSIENASKSTPDVKDLSVDNGSPIHVDHHAIAISSTNPSIVFDGSDGGLFKYDTTTTSWTDLNSDGLQISQFFGIAANPNNLNQILGGVQDNGSIFTINGITWNDISFKKSNGDETTGGDGGQVYFNPSNNQAYIINTGSLNSSSNPFVPNPDYQFAGGTTNSISGLHPVGLFPNEDYLMSPTNPNTLWLGTNTLYMTTDAGSNWYPITIFGTNGWPTPFNTTSPGFTDGLDTTVVDSIAAPTQNSTQLYVGLRGGHFLVTTNLPTTLPTDPNPNWVECDPIPITKENQSTYADLKFSNIQVDPTNPNIVYVTAAYHLGTSLNAHVWMGVFNPITQKINWSNLNGNLPDVPAWSIQVQHPSTVSLPTLYVGTDVGVFFSANLGASWSTVGSGLPNSQARVLNLNLNTANTTGQLLVGTLGHGAFQITTNPNAVPTTTSFIESVYFQLLGRAADSAGLANWTNALNASGNTPSGRTNVVSNIEKSQEYLNLVVTGLYGHYLNRAPDSAAQGWVTALANGSTIEQVSSGIISSTEFFKKSGGTNTGFVNALYTSILGRPSDPSGLEFWVNQLNSGKTPAWVAMSFLTSSEYRQDLVAGVGWTSTGGQAKPGYFQGYYLAYLNRQADKQGVTYWSGVLQNNGTDQQVIAGILGSTEYYGKSVVT